MAVPRVTVRPGREFVLGPERGSRAVARIRPAGGLDHLRGDVRADWEDDLARLEAGSSFPGVEFYAAYLEPSLPTLFDHLPKDALIIDFEPDRQLADVRELEHETTTLTEAEAVDHELPPGFRPPMVPGVRLGAGDWERIRITAGESEGGIDLGWLQPEPIVRRPAALNQLLAERDSVVLATEQSERLEALLAEAATGRQPIELDLDLDAMVAPGLLHGDADLPVGADNPGLGIAVLSDHELFGRVRRPVTRRGGPGIRPSRGPARRR